MPEMNHNTIYIYFSFRKYEIEWHVMIVVSNVLKNNQLIISITTSDKEFLLNICNSQ